MGTMSAIADDIVVVAELLLMAIVYRLLCISFLFYTDSWSQCSGDQGNTLGTISVTGEDRWSEGHSSQRTGDCCASTG